MSARKQNRLRPYEGRHLSDIAGFPAGLKKAKAACAALADECPESAYLYDVQYTEVYGGGPSYLRWIGLWHGSLADLERRLEAAGLSPVEVKLLHTR